MDWKRVLFWVWKPFDLLIAMAIILVTLPIIFGVWVLRMLYKQPVFFIALMLLALIIYYFVGLKPLGAP